MDAGGCCLYMLNDAANFVAKLPQRHASASATVEAV